MQERNIYSDIAKRTQGDIYIGVVGPVRTGKSTFIKRFMDALVLPNIESQSVRDRATDELPQSAAGRTIMTTEPKFIPENAVEISLQAEATFRVRLIDCVGYIVPSSLGYIEGESLFLAAPVAGTVGTLSAQEGQRVDAGARLFTIDPATLSAQGVYPSGLLVGTVSRVENDPSGLTRTAWVTPSLSLDSLRQVFVITDYTVER